MDCALIIFIKNPVKGHVKTRLAADVGDDAALKVYEKLLVHTRELCLETKVPKYLFYSMRVDPHDEWKASEFQKLEQEGRDLGERMYKAFDLVLKTHDAAIIIGSDCPGLSAQHLRSAFQALEQVDVVIGPSRDGGYYLLGIREVSEVLFEEIEWSTDRVLESTISRCKQNGLSFETLELLNDIDHLSDLEAYPWLLSIDE